jgi:hypothetical protein
MGESKKKQIGLSLRIFERQSQASERGGNLLADRPSANASQE